MEKGRLGQTTNNNNNIQKQIHQIKKIKKLHGARGRFLIMLTFQGLNE